MISVALWGAWASPTTWTEVSRDVDCSILTGADVVPGIPAMLAECTWADVSPAQVYAALADPVGQGRFVWSITDEREPLARTKAQVAVVVQRHEVFPLRPREVTIVHRSSFDGELGEVRWSLAPGAWPVSDGAVRVVENTGLVKIRPAETGAHFTIELSFAPGGSVPSWLVRWTQTDGVVRMLSALRKTAKGLP